jgi:hypothetical protein
MPKWLLLSEILTAFASSAQAQDQWTNGEPVPPWVKKACCGPEDAQHLTAQQVEYKSDGWHVDGYQKIIPHGAELPRPTARTGSSIAP